MERLRFILPFVVIAALAVLESGNREAPEPDESTEQTILRVENIWTAAWESCSDCTTSDRNIRQHGRWRSSCRQGGDLSRNRANEVFSCPQAGRR